MEHAPSLTALRCLDASARLGSFTRAGKEMHLTQSAVSHHILALERDLGVALFIRRRGGLELTPTGRMYWEETLHALHLLQRAGLRVKGASRQHSTVTISVPPSFAHLWLMPRVGAFVRDNRGITLNLVNRQDGGATRYGEEDASIELSEGNAAGFVSLRLLSLVYGLYGSPELLARLRVPRPSTARGPLKNGALGELLRSVPLIRTSMSDAWPGWLRMSKFDEFVTPAQLADGPVYAQASLALLAVINGTGVALLPRHVVEKPLQDGTVLKLSRIGWPALKAYHLQWSESIPVTPGLRRFAEWAATVAESEAEIST
jgi:LysR family transcriptional regulator, glycine cleavage system transcriptional activator